MTIKIRAMDEIKDLHSLLEGIKKSMGQKIWCAKLSLEFMSENPPAANELEKERESFKAAYINEMFQVIL